MMTEFHLKEVTIMRAKQKRAELLDMLLGQQKEVRDIKQWRQMEAIWLREKLDLTAPQVGEALNYKVQTVHILWHRWLQQGMALFKDRRAPGGRNHAYMAADEEGEFLKAFLDKAGSGGILQIQEIHRAYEEHVGRKVAKSTIYRLLHRQGWRKLMPRKKHPKSDPEVQQEVKKTF